MTVVDYENFCDTDSCLRNFDVETFRYRSLGILKWWLADNIKMCPMEVGFVLWLGREWNWFLFEYRDVLRCVC